eukprot:g2398.t1
MWGAGQLDICASLMFKFVDRHLAHGNSVLIHCYAGAHRSGTAGVAYLMHSSGLGAAEATKLAKRLRPVIDPPFRYGMFLSQTSLLQQLHEELVAAAAPRQPGGGAPAKPATNKPTTQSPRAKDTKAKTTTPKANANAAEPHSSKAIEKKQPTEAKALKDTTKGGVKIERAKGWNMIDEDPADASLSATNFEQGRSRTCGAQTDGPAPQSPAAKASPQKKTQEKAPAKEAIRDYVNRVERLVKENYGKDAELKRQEQKDKQELMKMIQDLDHRLSQRLDEMEDMQEQEGQKNDFETKKLNKRLAVAKGKTEVNTKQLDKVQAKIAKLAKDLAQLTEEVNGEGGGEDDDELLELHSGLEYDD